MRRIEGSLLIERVGVVTAWALCPEGTSVRLIDGVGVVRADSAAADRGHQHEAVLFPLRLLMLGEHSRYVMSALQSPATRLNQFGQEQYP